ncbi:MAG TPA: PD-(D/E)XK nuclease family protein [Gemmatimonadaceae bacterium]
MNPATDDALDSAPASPVVLAPRSPGSRPAILRSLEAATRAHPTDRKRLVAPDVNHGRELLVTLARSIGGWVGWEATNLRGIAEELAFVPLAERGVRAASDVEIAALVNRALDRALAGARVSDRFARLERGLGFRGALRDAILELRAAGARADDVSRAAEPGSPAHDLPAVLEEYERLLAERGITDPAGIFQAALDAFDREAPFVLDGVVLLAPPLAARGLAGELLARLIRAGARALSADAVLGIDPPTHVVAGRAREELPTIAGDADAGGCSALSWLWAQELPAPDDPRLDPWAVTVDLFAAATPSDELREVCRRVMAEGVRWDDVEIATTDPDTYGVALDALCQRLALGATMLHGVPLARTRLGRALERWLAWLDGGLQADVLRQALEAGELRAPAGELPPTALARELRALRVGWGRERWASALVALERGAPAAALARRDDEPDEDFERRREARARAGRSLGALLRALLDCTPEVPAPGSTRPVRSSCARLASATLGWLALVPLHGMAERHTSLRLRTRLEELAGIDEGDVPFTAALAALRDSLADVRAWPLVTEERKPWSAAGGMPHLTDIAHAGITGRARTFVIGLDAERTAGRGRQDPLLPDATRRRIASASLATSAERRADAAWTLGAAFARLRGRVTLSYATSGALDGREAGPSPVLLQAWRHARRDAALDYEALRAACHPPASAVPAHRAAGPATPAVPLDARDVWLDAIADGALLLDGDALVREAFPMLDAGLRGAELAEGGELTAHHGLVPRAAEVLDPLRGGEISPTALERLGACPLAWFYRYGLSLYLPDDPTYDATRWLDAIERGSLLHEVFETFARTYQGRRPEIARDAARVEMLRVVDEALARWRVEVPPPGEAVFEAEGAELRDAALTFLEMERTLLERGDRGRWLHLEYAFGSGEPAGRYALRDGRTIAVRGRADRVDALPDRSLRVIDYKTGRSSYYAKEPAKGPFNGGRQLQPALYAEAVGSLLGTPVSRFEYRFPTERGGNEIVGYDASELAVARDIIAGLLDHVRTGAFVPTTEAADCAWCEYQAICRARRVPFGTESPRAEWAKAHAPSLHLYRGMLARRGLGDAAGGGDA